VAGGGKADFFSFLCLFFLFPIESRSIVVFALLLVAGKPVTMGLRHGRLGGHGRTGAVPCFDETR
jgi:hypothetical protein